MFRLVQKFGLDPEFMFLDPQGPVFRRFKNAYGRVGELSFSRNFQHLGVRQPWSLRWHRVHILVTNPQKEYSGSLA